MPFFTRRAEAEEEVVPVQTAPVVEEKPKKHGIFGRRDHSPTSSVATSRSSSTRMTNSTYRTTPSTHETNGGVFRRSTDASSGSRGRSLLHRFGKDDDVMDPTIVQARERVMAAEAAEAEADRALEIARREVIAAREHAKRLELEAKEDARRAKIKSFHAKEVSKRAKPLGRHGLV